jgi:hypothetical protein
MTLHLPFIAPPATLLATGNGSSNGALSRRSLVALQFDDKPLRQIVRIGALASRTRWHVPLQYLLEERSPRFSGASSVVFSMFPNAITFSLNDD